MCLGLCASLLLVAFLTQGNAAHHSDELAAVPGHGDGQLASPGCEAHTLQHRGLLAIGGYGDDKDFGGYGGDKDSGGYGGDDGSGGYGGDTDSAEVGGDKGSGEDGGGADSGGNGG